MDNLSVIVNITDLTNLEALSLFYLSKLQLGFIGWIIFGLLNNTVAIFLLLVLNKWEIYMGYFWLLLKFHLCTEILMNFSGSIQAIWHLILNHFDMPEIIQQSTCHKITIIQKIWLGLSGWFSILISIDRYNAVTNPQNNDQR